MSERSVIRESNRSKDDGGEAGALGPDFIAESQGGDGDNEANAPEINDDQVEADCGQPCDGVQTKVLYSKGCRLLFSGGRGANGDIGLTKTAGHQYETYQTHESVREPPGKGSRVYIVHD